MSLSSTLSRLLICWQDLPLTAPGHAGEFSTAPSSMLTSSLRGTGSTEILYLNQNCQMLCGLSCPKKLRKGRSVLPSMADREFPAIVFLPSKKGSRFGPSATLNISTGKFYLSGCRIGHFRWAMAAGCDQLESYHWRRMQGYCRKRRSDCR